MEINDVNSALGIIFNEIESESKFIVYYKAIDYSKNNDVDSMRQKFRDVFKIEIPDYDRVEIQNIYVHCEKETGKVVKFMIEFIPHFDAPPYFSKAMVTKYGNPDERYELSACWTDADSSWVALMVQPTQGYKYLLDYIRICYGSPLHDKLSENEMVEELQKRMKKQKEEEERKKKAIMDSDF